MQYPYLKHIDIESQASKVLFDYEQKNGEIKAPSVPIEDIIELHLGLAICPIEEEDDLLGSVNKVIVSP